MNDKLIQEVETFANNYFNENDLEKLVYHDMYHTVEVVKAVKMIGVGNNLTDEEMEIVIISAWFHDLGYIDSRLDHEAISADLAVSFLTKNNYPFEKIEKVKSCILATKTSKIPQNVLEEVLCDADLIHMAKKSFIERSELLKSEFENFEGRSISANEWNEKTKKFVIQHEYFTPYAKEKYTTKKLGNIIKLKEKFDKIQFKMESDEFKKEKLFFEKQRLKNKKETSGKADRGIETMFRNVIRTHVEFSMMADNKANIMISINTLILTAIVAILARKLDTNPHLIIPTTLLTVVSLSTLIFATFVTRPKITDGTFTVDDIKNKRTNLLFFGNFYKMKLDDFTWGMKEMMNDKEFLYGNMIMDFYYLGQVLGRKYKFLNICYSIFMAGMIISVLAFGIAVLVYGDGKEFGNFID